MRSFLTLHLFSTGGEEAVFGSTDRPFVGLVITLYGCT
jgi:hypothetical protein